MTNTYYSTCEEALSGTFVNVGISEIYTSIPNGLNYFGLRDRNNPSNVVCVAANVDCTSGGGNVEPIFVIAD
jgi:hypothetical protein